MSRAMVLHAPGEPLRAEERPPIEPGSSEVVLDVAACGVCRTDLHIVDGELPDPTLPCRAHRIPNAAHAGDAALIGLFGFGAAAHIVCQLARHEGRRVFAVTRPDDIARGSFPLELGAEWAGAARGPLPEELDAVLIFAPPVSSCRPR